MEKITFEGDNIQVDNNSSNLLIVRDRENDKDLGVFRHWRYWREIDDGVKSSKSKVLIRPKRPITSQQIRTFIDALRNSDIVMIPNEYQIIVLDELGKIEVL